MSISLAPYLPCVSLPNFTKNIQQQLCLGLTSIPPKMPLLQQVLLGNICLYRKLLDPDRLRRENGLYQKSRQHRSELTLSGTSPRFVMMHFVNICIREVILYQIRCFFYTLCKGAPLPPGGGGVKPMCKNLCCGFV